MRVNSYTLSVIAETGERFSDFAPYVASVNDEGIVAFQATDRGGVSGAYAGDGGPIRVIADPTTAPFRGVCSHPDINGEGSSCFYADIESERRGVFLVRDGEVVLVADSAGPLGPTMNGAGTVAFRADLSGGSSGIFTASGGSVTTIAETDGTFSGLGLFPVPNDAGTVAFCAHLRAGGSGAFTVAAGEIETVMDTSGPFESFRGALVNDAGDLSILRDAEKRHARGVRRSGPDRRSRGLRGVAALRFSCRRLRPQPRVDEPDRSDTHSGRVGGPTTTHRAGRSAVT